MDCERSKHRKKKESINIKNLSVSRLLRDYQKSWEHLRGKIHADKVTVNNYKKLIKQFKPCDLSLMMNSYISGSPLKAAGIVHNINRKRKIDRNDLFDDVSESDEEVNDLNHNLPMLPHFPEDV